MNKRARLDAPAPAPAPAPHTVVQCQDLVAHMATFLTPKERAAGFVRVNRCFHLASEQANVWRAVVMTTQQERCYAMERHWRHIRELHLADVTMVPLEDWERMDAQLESITTDGVVWHEALGRNTLRLPKLRTLRVRTWDCVPMQTLPQLEELCVRSAPYNLNVEKMSAAPWANLKRFEGTLCDVIGQCLPERQLERLCVRSASVLMVRPRVIGEALRELKIIATSPLLRIVGDRAPNLVMLSVCFTVVGNSSNALRLLRLETKRSLRQLALIGAVFDDECLQYVAESCAAQLTELVIASLTSKQTISAGAWECLGPVCEANLKRLSISQYIEQVPTGLATTLQRCNQLRRLEVVTFREHKDVCKLQRLEQWLRSHSDHCHVEVTYNPFRLVDPLYIFN